MEILQTDDTLRKEIINDAKTKAERIIKKAKTEAEDINKDIEVQLEKIKVEYKQNIIDEADAIINLLYASVDIDAKKEIINICGSLVDDVFNEVEELIIKNKTFNYKDIIFKLIKNSGNKIKTQSFVIEISKDELKKLGVDVYKDLKIVIQNIVAISDLGTELNLNEVAMGLGLENVEYEPEQFPGLVYRIKEPKVAMLLFGSGKIVCTGARQTEDVSLAVEKLSAELSSLDLIKK